VRSLLSKSTITCLALVLPIAAFADLKGTINLNNGIALNLDTGATASTGGDILWNGANMTVQGSATALNLGAGGISTFNTIVANSSTISGLPFTKNPITSTANSVFAVKTNGGNLGIVLIGTIGLGSISIQYDTIGTSAGSSGPSISQVLNNYGLIPAGFPNSGVAQGALFIIKGSGLADPNAQAQLQDSTKGLPTTLNGASVKVTSGGVTTTPPFYYAIAGQLALVLPSNTPTGSATVTATYNGQTSTPFTFQVVASAMGFGAYYGTGAGLGIAVNTSTGGLYSYGAAIVPGATILLYGSGLGADSARDSQYVGAAFGINNLAHIYVGGVDVTPSTGILYQGASGFPGLNQVNLTIPANVPLGCNIPITGVTAAGVPTNTITVPISTGGPCSDPTFGLNGGQLQNLSAKATVNTAFVYLGQGTTTNASGTHVLNTAVATFQSYTGNTYASGGASGSISLNSCTVNQSLSGTTPTGTTTPLNPGTVTVTGPVGAPVPLVSNSFLPSTFFAQLPDGFIPSSGGSFAFAGTGGNTPTGGNVGNFSTTMSFSSPLMNWTNQSAAVNINRAAGFPVTWSGGALATFVLITGSSSNGTATGSFACYVPTSAGQFTVPAYITSALPAGPGGVNVENFTNYSSFTAAGIDFGVSAGFIGFDVSSTFN
jgi:uncharacterized protein (TIGR03437 family)